MFLLNFALGTLIRLLPLFLLIGISLLSGNLLANESEQRFPIISSAIEALTPPQLSDSRVVLVDKSHLDSRNANKLSVSPYFEYFKESESTGLNLSLGDVIYRIDALPWEMNKDAFGNFGETQGFYWAKFSITNENSPIEDWVLYNLEILPKHIDLFYVRDGRVIEHLQSGNDYAFENRDELYHRLSFPLALPKGESLDVIIKLHSTFLLSFPLFIDDERSFLKTTRYQSFFDGIYLGSMILIFLLNLFMYLGGRERAHRYLITFILFATLAVAQLKDYSSAFLIPANDYSLVLLFAFSILAALSGVVYTFTFINEKYPSKSNKVIHDIIVWFTFVMLLTLPFVASDYLFNFAFIIMCFLTIGGAFNVVSVMFREDAEEAAKRRANWIVIAWSPITLAVLFSVLDASSVVALPAEIDIAIIVQVSMLALVIMLTLSFSQNVLDEKVARVQAEFHATTVSEKNAELERINILDPLTQIKNRGYFDFALDREYKIAYRENQEIALCFVDLDHFKSINDTKGHMAGDVCLQIVAKVMDEVVTRPSDVVARYGGEEFAIILPNTNLESAHSIAEKIRHAIEHCVVEYEGESIPLTASVGVSVQKAYLVSDKNSLLAEADSAVYEAKKSGRNQTIIFTSATQGQIH